MNSLLLEKGYELYDLETGNFFQAPRLVYAPKSNIEMRNVRGREKIFITKLEENLLNLESNDRDAGVFLHDFLKDRLL